MLSFLTDKGMVDRLLRLVNLQEPEVEDALAIESPMIKPQSWPPSSRNSRRWGGRGSCVKPYKDLTTFMVRFSCSPAIPYFLRGEQRISNPNLHRARP